MRALKGAIWGVVLLVVTMAVVSASAVTSAAVTGASGTIGASGATLASTEATGGAASPSVHAPGLALEQKIMATAETDHIPIQAVSLPNLLGTPTKMSNGVITPTPVTPAPIGLGAYGVLNTSGTATAFTLDTQSWEGTITLNSPVNNFLLDNDGAASTSGTSNEFGVQLNAVMSDVTIGTTSDYSFWTQNVLYFNYPAPGTVTFLDNVWNFSSPAIYLAPGTLYSYNGTPVYPEYYYDFGPTYSISYPLTVHLYLNSSVSNLPDGYGYTTVKFGYDIVNAATGMSEASGIYDTVLFSSTTPSGSVPASPYLLDGSQYTPTGFIPWDAEIMIGGPGGGTTTSIFGISGSESLQYLDNSGQYLNAPAAWNVASETGETSEGIAVSYTSPGTVDLNAGPFLTTPLWNSTPGGNLGQATFAGQLSPSNAFVFASPGSIFDTNFAGWAPTQTATTVNYVLPPGTYTFEAMLSDYNPIVTTATAGKGGFANLHFVLSPNYHAGVYTPLVAWDNAQLAAISFGGFGTSWSPYLLVNNPSPGGGLNPVFGQFNDYLYQVFPGVLLAGTTAYVDLVNPSLLQVTYQTGYDAVLSHYGLPFTNNLQFEIVDASHVSLWGAKGITGWFFFLDYGPTGFLPLANVVVWGGSDNLIGDNSFVSQGSSLVLADYAPGPSGNVVWGNTFVNSTQLAPAMYPGNGAENGPPIAIFAFEAGDLIYNNYVATSITAFAPNANMFFGSYQVNAENWNLPMVEPAFSPMQVNGFWLSGTIVRSMWQGGNFWADYVPGSPLPYDEFGYIATGGDYFPYPITAYSVTFHLMERGPGVDWSVTLNGVTQSTTSSSLVFYETPGTYGYTAAILHGKGSISPSSGTVTVVNSNVFVQLNVT